MNRTKAREIKHIFDAFCEGKKIQYQTSNGTWEDTDILEIEGFPAERYRVKPETEPVVPYRRYLYWNHAQELVVGTAMEDWPKVQAMDSFLKWIDTQDQTYEIESQEVQKHLAEKEAKANQGKPADPNTPTKGGKAK